MHAPDADNVGLDSEKVNHTLSIRNILLGLEGNSLLKFSGK